MTDSDQEDSRRPLKSRNTKIAHAIAAKISKTGIKPNSISILSIFFAFLTCLCYLYIPSNQDHLKIILYISAALFIQMRLLCNLFDGMVAVENGLKTKSGEIFNDFPDRIADVLILVGAGYSIEGYPYSIELGWLAGSLALLTAYTRVLGKSTGTQQYFTGPMAKQHRMAVVTLLSISAALLTKWNLNDKAFYYGLIVICFGSLLTTFLRVKKIIKELESK